MKINPLPSWEYLNECFELDETCQSGLRWKERPQSHGENIGAFNRRWEGQEAGNRSPSGYSEIKLDNKAYRSHRLLYSLYHRENIDDKLIDHKDRNVINNSIDNLRCATHQQNQWNAGLSKNNTSGYKSIRTRKLKNGKFSYEVRVMVDYKLHRLGTFRDLNKAIKAHTDFINNHHGEFSSPNNVNNEQNNEQNNVLMVLKEQPFQFAVY